MYSVSFIHKKNNLQTIIGKLAEVIVFSFFIILGIIIGKILYSTIVSQFGYALKNYCTIEDILSLFFTIASTIILILSSWNIAKIIIKDQSLLPTERNKISKIVIKIPISIILLFLLLGSLLLIIGLIYITMMLFSIFVPKSLFSRMFFSLLLFSLSISLQVYGIVATITE